MKKSFIILSLLLAASLAYSQYHPVALPFLRFNASARAAGMAGAYGAIADDASAMHYNPAGLARLRYLGAEGNYVQWLPDVFDDMTYLYQAIAFKIPHAGRFGISYQYFSYGELHFTSGATPEYRTISPTDAAIGFSYAANLSKMISIGLSTRYCYFEYPAFDDHPVLDDHWGITAKTSSAWSFDVGIIFQNFLPSLSLHQRFMYKRLTKWTMHRIPPGPSIGLSILNMGNKVKFDNESDPLPQNLRLSLAWNIIDMDVFGLLITTDIQKLLVHWDNKDKADEFYQAIFSSWDTGLQESEYSCGLELSAFTFASIRAGYYYNDYGSGDTDYFSLGLGLGPETARFNMSYWFTEKGDPMDGTMYFGIVVAY